MKGQFNGLNDFWKVALVIVATCLLAYGTPRSVMAEDKATQMLSDRAKAYIEYKKSGGAVNKLLNGMGMIANPFISTHRTRKGSARILQLNQGNKWLPIFQPPDDETPALDFNNKGYVVVFSVTNTDKTPWNFKKAKYYAVSEHGSRFLFEFYRIYQSEGIQNSFNLNPGHSMGIVCRSPISPSEPVKKFVIEWNDESVYFVHPDEIEQYESWWGAMKLKHGWLEKLEGAVT